MCGIAGFLSERASGPTARQRVALMLGGLSHRGPDGTGLFSQSTMAVGMVRLAICDPASGQQPLTSEDGGVRAVVNGEIYNHQELRRHLERRGHRFRSHTDVEVVVHLYEQYGPGYVERLHGMFAIALWDAARRQLHLARDREGIKPLLVRRVPEGFAFASELKALLRLPPTPVLRSGALATYLTYRVVPGRETLVQDVERVLPGERWVVTRSGQGQRVFYSRPELAVHDDPHALDALEETLGRAIVSHLQGDRPMGLFLSGGIDSVSILAGLKRWTGRSLPTFTAGFTGMGPEGEEFAPARSAARLFGTEHHEVAIDPGGVAADLPAIVAALDEPVGDPTAIPLWYLARAASQKVTVVLSGEGADELMAGYPGYLEPAAVARARRLLPARLLEGPLGRWAARYPGVKGAGLVRRATLPLAERYRGVGMTFDPEGVLRLLGPGAHDPDPGAMARDALRHWAQIGEINAMLEVDRRVWLADDVLTKLDRITMHHGLEARVPFLDDAVAALARTLPGELKIRGRTTKWCLRQVARRWLPSGSADQPKRGFPVAIGRLLATELRELLHDTLTDTRARQRGLMNPDAVRAIITDLPDRASHRGRQAYALLVLEMWHREVLEAPVPGEVALDAEEVEVRSEELP